MSLSTSSYLIKFKNIQTTTKFSYKIKNKYTENIPSLTEIIKHFTVKI